MKKKQLEWTGKPHAQRAETQLGVYTASRGRWYFNLGPTNWVEPCTMDAAKAACQADFERRVREMEPPAIANQLEFLARRLRNGCGNAGCIVKEPEGMHTNGCCNCQPKHYASLLMGLAIECEQMGYKWGKEER